MAVIFPRWTNRIPAILTAGAGLGTIALVSFVWYYFSPRYTDVGYQPRQPIPHSHKQHAGELGMDCRYCHNTVEHAARAALPPTESCLGCHKQLILPKSVALAPLRLSAAADRPIPWIRVHQLPDYAYFDHSVHLAAGVGCTTCHGRVDQMAVIALDQPLSMSWCLDCHRNPKPNLRPLEEITQMAYDATKAGYDPDKDPLRKRQVTPPLHCSGCHR